MNARDAIRRAKEYVNDVFSDENITNLGLEEIEFDETDRTWNVTIGFSRPWNSVRNTLTAITGEPAVKRAYKIVKLRDDDGQMISVKRRDAQD